MKLRVKIIVKWHALFRFWGETFATLLAILLIYSLVVRPGYPLSWADIKNNYVYILAIYVAMGLIASIIKGMIGISQKK